jgi:hypothetical protein
METAATSTVKNPVSLNVELMFARNRDAVVEGTTNMDGRGGVGETI